LAPTGCEEPPVSFEEDREPCADKNPHRNVYFGDLHAHTGFSWDAWGYDNFMTPGDAYRFAKGEPIKLPPLDENEVGTRTVQLDRPLDFVLVSDHMEFLGEVYLCTVDGQPGYDTSECAALRERNTNGVTIFGMQTAFSDPERFELCPPDEPTCITAAAEVRWHDMVMAAEEHYDRTSSCEFVPFVGYEYTATPFTSNLHRNVIFRNHHVPALPPSYFEAQSAYELWRGLKEGCIDGMKKCDVMTIAHNSNLSNGNLFYPDYGEGLTEAEQAEAARLRARLEPLVEIFQHKGSMECRNGLSGIGGEPDPLCDFEKLRKDDPEDCGDSTGDGGMRLGGCVSRLDFVRNVLKEGLKEEQRIGVNPYKLGIIASTDTHNAIPGYVREDGYLGHIGTVDDTPEERLGTGTLTHDTIINNPGGLVAVWAEENSRDAIFRALRRKEVYGTSGPRMVVRLFGGWELSEGLCEDGQWLSEADEAGVPMGGDLPSRPAEGGAPRFFVRAMADGGTAEHPGAPLQRIQIIKGWIDGQGNPKEKVYEVAGDPENGATVDPATCERSGEGFDELCAVWTDPDFDPALRAFYYVRAVENPTCRWTTWECNRLPEAARPEGCEDPSIPKTVQERAWSSPIWYTP
jgi:hypothetical protein